MADQEQKVRDKFAEDVNNSILDPLGLLAAALLDDKENTIRPDVFGNLLGLIVRGARSEVKIMAMGGYGALALANFLGEELDL